VHPCDKRRDVSHYKQRFPAVDFSLIDSEADVLWHEHKRETNEEIRARGAKFLQYLATRPEKHIAVVAHSSFLHFMLSNFAQQAGSETEHAHLLKHFENCEMRSVVMAVKGSDVPADHFHFAGGASVARPPAK
jgi:broad specificity phosphatase PhoE